MKKSSVLSSRSSEPRRDWAITKCIISVEKHECVLAKLLQLCLTLCNPMDCSAPDFSIHGFSRQEYWSGLPGIKPTFLMSSALAGGFFTTSATWQTPKHMNTHVNWWKWKLWIVSFQLRSGYKAKIWAKFIQNLSL